MLLKEIVNGKHNGSVFWICDFRYTDFNNSKPIRHVKPTKVMVFGNENLPKNKTVYYSDSHFRPVNKAGEATTKIIAPFDNTGYRGRTGDGVKVFNSETECKECYVKQCEDVIEGLHIWLTEKKKFVEDTEREIRNTIKNL